MKKLLVGILTVLALLLAVAAEAPAQTIREQLATQLSLSAAAESADNIDVTVTGPASTDCVASSYAITGIESLAAAYAIAEVGDGAEVSTTANARLVFTTAADGDATLRVNDVSGGTNTTTIFEVWCYGVISEPEYVILTWDNGEALDPIPIPIAAAGLPDFSKDQIVCADGAWLSYAGIRLGVIRDNAIEYLAMYSPVNVDVGPWTATFRLPGVRWEIEHLGDYIATREGRFDDLNGYALELRFPADSGVYLETMCASVDIEGSNEAFTREVNATRGQSEVTITTAAFIPLLAFRINPDHARRVNARITRLGIMPTSTAKSMEWCLRARADIVGLAAAEAGWEDVEHTAIQVHRSLTGAITNGKQLAGCYLEAHTMLDVETQGQDIMGVDIDGNPDVWVIGGRGLDGNVDVLAGACLNEW